MFSIREFCLWIYFVVNFSNNFSSSSPSNQTHSSVSNITTTSSPTTATSWNENNNGSFSSIPPDFYTPPLMPSCVDKKVWNICWLKKPPYIFNKPDNKSIVEGILIDAIIKGLQKCECQANLNFTLRVYDEKELVNCSNDKNIDLVVPFPRSGIIKNSWFFKVVNSAAIYLLLNREKIIAKAKSNIYLEFSQVWTLAVLTILLAAIFGIIVWSLDSAWNQNQFPPSFCPGAIEGVWWSFVTLTTVGYGDKTPKFPLARIFAIIWMFVGMCLVSLLTATMTKALTTGLVENQRDFNDLKIGVLKSSHTYDEAVKKGAKTKKFQDLKTMFTALDNNDIQGILLDIFVATYVRNNLNSFGFHDNIFVAQTYDIQYSIGFYFGNGMVEYETEDSPLKVLTNCLESTFETSNRRLDVFAIVDKYIQSQETVKKSSKPYDQFKIEIDLFAQSSVIFLEGLKALCIILGVMIFLGIAWEIIRRRWKRSFELSKPSGEFIAMSGHQRINVENIHKMAKKLDEVEKALSKVTEFREMYKNCKVDMDKYNTGMSNGNPHGTTNIGYINNA